MHQQINTVSDARCQRQLHADDTIDVVNLRLCCNSFLQLLQQLVHNLAQGDPSDGAWIQVWQLRRLCMQYNILCNTILGDV